MIAYDLHAMSKLSTWLCFLSSGAQNRLGGFFFCLAFLAFTSSTTVEVLHAERTVVLREVKAGYYSPLPYLLSKIILDALLLRAIPALLLGIPYYKLSGLEVWKAFGNIYNLKLVLLDKQNALKVMLSSIAVAICLVGYFALLVGTALMKSFATVLEHITQLVSSSN